MLDIFIKSDLQHDGKIFNERNFYDKHKDITCTGSFLHYVTYTICNRGMKSYECVVNGFIKVIGPLLNHFYNPSDAH